MRTHDLQTALESLWTTQDVARVFRVTPMTIHLWRQNRGMPAIVIPGEGRPAVRFREDDVCEWARSHGIRVYLPMTGPVQVRPITAREAVAA